MNIFETAKAKYDANPDSSINGIRFFILECAMHNNGYLDYDEMQAALGYCDLVEEQMTKTGSIKKIYVVSVDIDNCADYEETRVRYDLNLRVFTSEESAEKFTKDQFRMYMAILDIEPNCENFKRMDGTLDMYSFDKFDDTYYVTTTIEEFTVQEER